MEPGRTARDNAHRETIIKQESLHAIGAATNGDIIAVQREARDDIRILIGIQLRREDNREAEHRGGTACVADEIKEWLGAGRQSGWVNDLLSLLIGSRTKEGAVNCPDHEACGNGTD